MPSPAASNDPETVGLFGAIHKQLFDAGQGQEHLNVAIRCYGRGYFLRDDWYNGINLAYLLNVRADTPLDARKEDQIADLVWANRIRREVLTLCDKNLKEIAVREHRPSGDAGVLQQDQEARDHDQKFWCLATKAEAHLGLGELEDYAKCREQALALDPAGWMVESFDQQIGRLRGLLEKHEDLLGSPQHKQAP